MAAATQPKFEPEARTGAPAKDEPKSEAMTVGGGVKILRSQYLAGFHGSSYPTVPMCDEKSEATFDGTIDDLAAKYPELEPTLYNDVKICGKCGKPCAFTMTTCNSCGTSLADVKISKSENVFSAFLFGVKKAGRGFPYTISLRRQTPEVLVFDDMLALTPCHLNGVSSKYYIPDWRFLLTTPAKSLELLKTMEEELWQATLPFLRNAEFRKVVLKGERTDEELRGMIIKSFNFPPSQFQMHVQWLLPPLVPFQHLMAEMRNHFHEDRAFPLSYVKKVLELNIPYAVNKDTPIQDIVDFYDKKGVVYKTCWAEFFEKALQDSMELANWNPEDFKYVVEGGKVYNLEVAARQVTKGAEVDAVTPMAVQEKDKVQLQNYGRPYNDAGKATGTYVKSPLEPKLGPGGYEKWPGVFEASVQEGSTCACGMTRVSE